MWGFWLRLPSFKHHYHLASNLDSSLMKRTTNPQLIFVRCSDTKESMDVWARLNPSNTLKLWSGAEVKVRLAFAKFHNGTNLALTPFSSVPQKLWAEHFPQYKYLWRKIMPIQRADIGRLMITLVHGGFYADLDTRPGQPVDAMLDNAGLRRVVHDAAVCVEDHKTPEAMAHTAKWPIRKVRVWKEG